ncbi:MAG: TlyA family RNA methyltransferase [Magnetospiraceae bacterium]
MSDPRRRLDVVLVDQGLAPSRAKARALITQKQVFLDNSQLVKPATLVALDAPLEVRGDDLPWVSRAGLKLAHALDVFSLSPEKRICLDVGASTGGFTDVLLQRGAARVYAIDVGHDQMAPTLAKDPRVILKEGVNARYLDGETIPEPVSALVCDVSFIGLRLVLPACLTLVQPGGWIVALIKPQFEVGREKVGKGGIVRATADQEGARDSVSAWLAEQPGWCLIGTTESPVLGSDGNREFLMAGVFTLGPGL